MITKTIRTFESLKDLIDNRDVAEVGDPVKICDEHLSTPRFISYNVAHKTENGKLYLIRTNIMSEYRPMKTEGFNLLEWLDGEFKEKVFKNENLPEEYHSHIKITLPTVGNVFGCEKFGVKPEGEFWEWFKAPLNRIAIKEDIEESDWYWLRDPVSASYFAFVYDNGGANYHHASHTWIGVRPAFEVF